MSYVIWVVQMKNNEKMLVDIRSQMVENSEVYLLYVPHRKLRQSILEMNLVRNSNILDHVVL